MACPMGSCPRGHRGKVEEIDRDGGGCDVVPRVRRESQAQYLTQGQPVVTDPEFACAGHVRVRLGEVRLYAGRETVEHCLLHQLVMEINGQLSSVYGEGIAGNRQLAPRCLTHGCTVGDYIRSRLRVAHEVAARGKEPGKALDLPPLSIGLARNGAVTVDTHFNSRRGVHDAAAVGPDGQLERLGRQVRGALHVECGGLACTSGVDHGRRRRGCLTDVGAETIGAGLGNARPDRVKGGRFFGCAPEA